MKQLPTDTPSHVKALNKLERKAVDKGTATLPDIEQRYRIECLVSRVNTKDETTTIACALLLSEPQTPLNFHFWKIKYHFW